MVSMNNIAGAVRLIDEQINSNPHLLGIQLFTRALGESIADEAYQPVFEAIHRHNLCIWLHPVFDNRKPDNNIVFSWEHGLSQAMMQLVQAKIFDKYPNIKIIVHHAGAMVPFFAGRIKYILGDNALADFKKFYVDTAILGNPRALELTASFYGAEHLIFGTDAPLGIPPAGATKEILATIDEMNVADDVKLAIRQRNILQLVG